MTFDLSPQNSQYLSKAVADGVYPSLQAALDAAVDALRKQSERLPMVPDEHMDAVEEALADLEAGIEEDWDVEEEKRRFRQRIAARQAEGGA